MGQLPGRLTAVDGMSVAPIFGSGFEIAMAQRLDIDVNIPAGGGAFPDLTQLEGGKARTGIMMASASAAIARISIEAELIAPPVLLDLERQLHGSEGLAPRAGVAGSNSTL